jgi:acylpyruvate hydrolase
MQFSFCEVDGIAVVAVLHGATWHRLDQLGLPFAVGVEAMAALTIEHRAAITKRLADHAGPILDLNETKLLPPIAPHARIFCVGLNYADHADESKMEKPAFPVVFLRTYDSFVGHGQPLVLPALSQAFDFEGEMVAILGSGGRYIDVADAVHHVAGYSVSNEGSIRDYQLKKGPQWTMGKNFVQSGSIGPVFITADVLPPLGKGLKITTRLNGETVQSSNTANMIFDVAQIIAYLSEAFLLKSGDVIVTGTPSGVGAARTPQLFMRDGDVVEVEVDQIGIVGNRVVQEIHAARSN